MAEGGLRGARAGRPLRARAARRDRRHEPPRSARPDDAGVGRRAVRRACEGVRLEGARHRRPPARRHRPRVRAGGTVRSPDVHRRAHEEGRGRVVPRGQGGLARQGALEGRRRGRSRSSATSLRSRRGPAGPAPDEAAPRAASGRHEALRYDVGARVATREAFGTPSGRWAPRAGTSSRSTGRSATRRTRSGSRRRTRIGSSRCTSPSSSSSPRRSACRCSGSSRSRRRSPPSSRAYDQIRMAAVSRARLCLVGCTRACRSARTALPRWRSRTSR